MKNQDTKYSELWLLAMFASLTLVITGKMNVLVLIPCLAILLLSVMAVLLLIIKDAYSRYLTDNIEKGIALCLLGGFSGVIPELIDFSAANNDAVFRVAMLPFTVFMLAGAGAGGSVLATGIDIKNKQSNALQSAINATANRNKQKKGRR